VSCLAFTLVEAILPISNHTISEYVQPYKVSTRRNDEGKLVYYLSDVTDIPVEL
jgi:hypothetical protein